MYEARQDISMLQQEDLAMFGRLILNLCCNNLAAVNNLAKSMETLARHYSPEIKNLVLYLLSKPSPIKVSTVFRDILKCCLLALARISGSCST